MNRLVKEILLSISQEMQIFEDKFYKEMKSHVPLLDKISRYLIYQKGKQMRPMFTLLTAKMLKDEVNEKTYNMASLIELIHTATLVHDDVVDESPLRRGLLSINAIWKNKIAVLLGDYLFSRSLLLATENKYPDLLNIIAHVIKKMSEGELLQMEKARKLNITKEEYYQIIQSKTASLISACCQGGASSVTSDEKIISQMHQFGHLVGMAFQIKDDLFDYESSSFTGKPMGIDIKERKLTLPLIHVLETSSPKRRRWLINSIKNHNQDKGRVREIITCVIESGGVIYAKEKINELSGQALAILETCPKNSANDSLRRMVHYVIQRKS